MSIIRTKRRGFTLEWREHGRWEKSLATFSSPSKAKEHAQMIGVFGLIRILPEKDGDYNEYNQNQEA